MLRILIAIPATYLIGSVNFSLVLFKLLGKDDPRNKFSGNAGTTNVYRQAGLFWAALVFFLEMGKAVGIAYFSICALEMKYVPWIGLTLILGNRYPCFHRFRGGKGVANYLGFSVLITPLVAGVASLLWVVIYKIVRIPFIASFFMILTLGAGALGEFYDSPSAMVGTIATVLLILHNHRLNAVRLMEERRAQKPSVHQVY